MISSVNVFIYFEPKSLEIKFGELNNFIEPSPIIIKYRESSIIND